jgi:hypothetical protein
MFIDPNIFFLFIYKIMTRRRAPKRACLQIVILSLLHFGVVKHSAEMLMGACLLAITQAHFTFGPITLCACLYPYFINQL